LADRQGCPQKAAEDSANRIICGLFSMPTTSFKSASRQQDNVLAAVEKRTLVWLAHRMPSWVSSDHLTLLGFFGMVMTGVCYYLSRFNPYFLIASVGFLAINWFGDSLDGTLARVRNRQRPRYGFYVDHVVDMFGSLAMLAGLGMSGFMNPALAMGLLIAYLMLSTEIYLATYTIGVFKLSFGWWGPTELRVLLAIGNIVLLFKPLVTIRGELYRLYDVGAVVGIIGIAIVLVISVVRNTIRLYREERLP
jgi:phosphatidylglycerophosphate synthase